MTDPKTTVGIVGLGHNGIAHGRAHLALGRSRLAALCDLSRDRLEHAGRELGVEALYTDVEAFLTHPDVDAVSIHTGDAQHRDPFVRALAAGKHVLVEKPLANTEEDVRAMVDAARGADPALKIQVGYILRFNPLFEAIHHLAREGQLGEIFHMEADYVHNLLYQAGQVDEVTGRNWYLEQELPMVGGGSHPLDLLRWISGKEVTRVCGYANHTAFPAMRHDDCQVALFQFADGAIAKVAALYGPRCPMAPYYNLRVYGTKGTVEKDTVALSKSPDDVHPPFVPIEAERDGGHPYGPEIADWLAAIADNRPVRTNLYDGANSTIATLCAVRAVEKGAPVDVPTFGPNRNAWEPRDPLDPAGAACALYY